MRVALFGGTFDPVHLGHTAIAECAWREERLDRVFFVPARQSPFKGGLPAASDGQRSSMIEIAIRDLHWASLWRGELERPAPSYSWQTVAFFRNALPGSDLFWILGADQWATLPSWAQAGYLARTLTFLVFRRGNAPGAAPGFRMKVLSVTHPARATVIRGGAREHLDPRVARYIGIHGIYGACEGGSGVRSVMPGRCASAGPSGWDRGP